MQEGGSRSRSVSWEQLLEQWELVEFAFHQQLHTDLDSIGNTRSWRWFAARVRVLLTTQNPLQAHFAPPHTEEPDDGS